jgi:tetratricopeptide (TPR) repeat protein
MAKTPSTRLFLFIKSLTAAEKRYFKIFTGKKEAKSNKYVLLFDAIDAQQEFNEDALIKTVYGDEPVETRKYSELKSYLYDLVLKSLLAYDEKSSVDFRLKNSLLGVHTLFKRSHFDDCKELLRKCKKPAQDFEDFNALVEILNWEKRIAYTQTDIAFLDRELENLWEEERTYLQRLHNISEYRNIFFKMLVSIRKDASRRDKQLAELASLMDNPLLKDERSAGSYKSKVLFYRIHSIYYFSVSDLEAFYKTNKKLLELMESNRALLREDVSEYISALNNHVISCGKLKRFDEVRATLEKLIDVKPITSDDELKIHRQYYMNKFALCISTGKFEEGLKDLKRHLAEIEKFDTRQFSKSNFYLQYFCIYFGAGDYENALNSLNEWLNLSAGIERKDLQSFGRILNLIIHFELGNTILLDSLLRSTYRFLSKENRLSEFEREVMQFIREASKPHSKKEMRQILETLKQYFEELSHSPSFGVLELFDVISWLESKISGKPFGEVVRERHRLSGSIV